MRASIGDVRLFFDVDGESLRRDGDQTREVPTLVLVHGGPGGADHLWFKPLFARLSDVAQVVYFDQRGCGRSDRSTRDHWNLAQWADDIRAICDTLEIRKPIVLGTSFGGPVAMNYVIRHPDHPGGLIVCGATARWRIDRVLDAFERLGGARARDVAARFWDHPTYQGQDEYMRMAAPLIIPLTRKGPPTEREQEWLKTAYSQPFPNQEVCDFFFGAEWKTFNLLPDLNRIRCPTLVLSDGDPLVGLEDANDMVAAMPAWLVRHEHFPEAGHCIVGEQPDRFLAVVRSFISDCARNSDAR
jgi:pimeloyl-ACP methyl ester carboxylesterase